MYCKRDFLSTVNVAQLIIFLFFLCQPAPVSKSNVIEASLSQHIQEAVNDLLRNIFFKFNIFLLMGQQG